MSDDTSGPRIFIPPPLVFVGGWVVAWLLSSRKPFAIDRAGVSLLQEVVGLVALASGLLLMGWGAVTFIRLRTPVVPIRPARHMVTGGPFRFTRNPMYFGLTIAYVGLAAITNQAWPIVVLPLVLIVLEQFVIAREEAHLYSRFGDDYDRYRRQVRRWL